MPAADRRLVILGATGSVGGQALALLDTIPDLELVAASAHRSAEALARLAAASCTHPRVFLTSDAPQSDALLAFLRGGDYEICLQAMVGAAGLPYSQAVLEAGRCLALANKESLVLAGGLLTQLARERGGRILPVDSEHSAIHQCLAGRCPEEVRGLYLTASGGALRDHDPDSLHAVSPREALAHPNWEMGPRITVDSATMFNKALEILEAHHLFAIPARDIHVLVHRQSVIHSMVEFVDGAVLAQLGPPDMAFPIHYALCWPDRVPAARQGFDPALFRELTLEEPDESRYPALQLGWEAACRGGAAGAVLNAADEIAVEAFLDGDLPFPGIATLCRAVLEAWPDQAADSIEDVLEADRWARQEARRRMPALR